MNTQHSSLPFSRKVSK